MASKMLPSLVPTQSADGVTGDIPAIAYSEQVLAEKEANLRKVIQENYAKIQAVEKELEALHLEVKLTTGSKKAGMEMLRQKIEQATERIKGARVKEQQAKKVWEAAQKVVQAEEEKKQKLCDDLRLMVQENAMQQYERLEALTLKLDSLNPEVAGVAKQAIEGLRAKIAPHGVPVLARTDKEGATTTSSATEPTGDKSSEQAHETEGPRDNSAKQPEGDTSLGVGPASKWASKVQNGSVPAATADVASSSSSSSGQPAQSASAGARPTIRGRGRGRGRGGQGRLVRGAAASGGMKLGDSSSSSTWTGAGFDVDEDDF